MGPGANLHCGDRCCGGAGMDDDTIRRVFQALRIVVNDELAQLNCGLEAALTAIAMESKDPYAQGATDAVLGYAMALGRAMALQPGPLRPAARQARRSPTVSAPHAPRRRRALGGTRPTR